MRNLITLAIIMAAIIFFWSKPSAESSNVASTIESPAPISPFEIMPYPPTTNVAPSTHLTAAASSTQ